MVKKIECRVIQSRPRPPQDDIDPVGPKTDRPHRYGIAIRGLSASAHASQKNRFVPARSNAHIGNHTYLRTPAIPRGIFLDAWA